MSPRGAGPGNPWTLGKSRPFYYQTGPNETDVGGILLESFSVEGKLLPEYLDISGVTVLVSTVERNGRYVMSAPVCRATVFVSPATSSQRPL